ncbi:kinase-like domain-containing protein, partial [Leptodontidium sp. 2 PMI_412]
MDLREFQTKRSSLPFATKKSIALNIARGLSALHQCGVIHGDMKPENVLIFYKPELHAKIADFSHSFL